MMAPSLAGSIDRLFIAGHRAARPYAGIILQELQVPRPHFGALIDLRALLLHTGVTDEEAATMQRFAFRDPVVASLVELERYGLLSRYDERYEPTAQGRAVLLRLTEAQRRGIADLWAGESGVEQAIPLVERLIATARSLPGPFPAFTLVVPTIHAEETPAYRLWLGLGALRYLRQDIHVTAIEAADLTRAEAAVLTALWKRPGPQPAESLLRTYPSDAMLRLAERGWIAAPADGYALTGKGKLAREMLEEATDRGMGPVLGALTAAEGAALTEILAALRDTPN